MAGNEVRAYNVSVSGFSAGQIGGSRSRIYGVWVKAEAACAFTITNGNGGETLLDLTLPVGWNDVYIPCDGILATSGCWVSAFTGTGNKMTLILQ